MTKFRLIFIICVAAALAYGLYAYSQKHDIRRSISDVADSAGIDLQFPEDQSGDPMLITGKSGETQKKSGQFYKWTDSAGVIHYTNDPDAIPPQYRNRLEEIGTKTVAVGDAVIEQAIEKQRDTAEKQTPPQVRLFVSLDCPDCERTRELLEKMAVDFKELNIDTDSAALTELKRISAGHW